jgi:hypothetical protein
MRKEPQEDVIDPTRPALIVLYGATRRKFRPLEGDVCVLGRAPGCDIGLMSPDVAPVHCVLVRLANGWRIRDCSGRATRLNGRAIHDEPLRNGDTIQIGTFSFEAQLPGATGGPALNGPPPHVRVIDRLQRSRRRLVDLALGLRRRCRDLAEENAHEQAELARLQSDLEMLERRMRQTYEQRQGQLNDEQQKVARREKELAKRSEELDAYARYLRSEIERTRREAQVQTEEAEADLVAQRVAQNQEIKRLTQWQHDLQARQTRLDLVESEVEESFNHDRDQIAQDREQIAREREYLDRERQEVVKMRAELEQLKDQLAQQTAGVAISSRDTQVDATGDDQQRPGSSARRLLRELAERRRASNESRPRFGGVNPLEETPTS